MRARTFCGAVVTAAALAVTGTGVANAQPTDHVNPTDYLIGDTVYFTAAGANCSIRANGDVGCDIPAGIAKWLNVIPVRDLVIDVPFLPAHPTFGAFGPQGRADSRSLPGGPIGYGSTISYAGASCHGGGRGGLSCQSKGHSFSFGWSGTQTS
ncbi:MULTISPECIES: hypothetical protein [unclassified Nocardia]|uniref:hypothetical protein n=1 Tax=unclassified Nocardia TaxID=2637762 RepID=UPI0024A7AF37|nr:MULTISPECIES: hypothetical protein [unclassified Nocardia]